jgi:glucose-6-phosphate isomerase
VNTLLPNFRLEYDSLWNLLPKNVPSLEVTPETVLNQSRSRFDSDVGFYHLPIHTAVESVQAMENLAQKWRAQLDGVVIFGIGGSFLGPAAVVESLKRCDDPFQILWLSNSDGPEIKRVAHAIQNKRFGAVVISKSGTTVETLTSFFHLSRHFKNEHIAVVTDPEKGELRRLASAQNWASFPIPHNIGGRFSVLSAVGLLPTALAGLSASSLISGAKLMREALERFPQEENPALQLAESIFRWDKQLKRNVHVLMPYEKRLKLFADWWVQLFGESIGKKTDCHSP